MPLLELHAVEAGFGPTTVLHGVDLVVEEGDFSAMLGLNGAGKSVTMKVAGGQVPARAGRVLFAGEDITTLPVEQRVARGMAFVPQGRQLFPQLTVQENLRLGAYLPRRRHRAQSEQRLAGILDRFPRLAERRDQPAGTMSGGEQAMLAVARALMGEPKLLLVDEPSAGLSPLVGAQVFDLLAEVHASGVAVLLVEQNVPLALKVAAWVNVMQRGRVVYSALAGQVDHDRLAADLGIGRLLRPTSGGDANGRENGTSNGPSNGKVLATVRRRRKPAEAG